VNFIPLVFVPLVLVLVKLVFTGFSLVYFFFFWGGGENVADGVRKP
jgi:hypothetical protein